MLAQSDFHWAIGILQGAFNQPSRRRSADLNAFQRVIDNVPCLIDTKFVRPLAASLQACLIRELKLGQAEGNAKCAEYLMEDPMVVSRRADLMQRRKMLERVQEDLLNFGM